MLAATSSSPGNLSASFLRFHRRFLSLSTRIMQVKKRNASLKMKNNPYEQALSTRHMQVYGRERKETGCEERKASHRMGPNNFHKTQTITAHGGPADRAVAAAFWYLQPAFGSRSRCAADGHDGH